MNNTHTPGPWRVVERANGQAFSIGCQVQTKGNFLTTHYIANVTDMATPQAEANARLIAAAPTMIEAMQTALTHLEACYDVDGDNMADSDAANILRAAIEAAKGEEV